MAWPAADKRVVCICLPTRCAACQRCLDDFKQSAANSVIASASSTPAQLASSFRAACILKERPSAACDRAEKAITGSFKGNMARRVGGICRVLGECDTGLATNASCVLTNGAFNGTLSECLLEGTSAGAAVDGIWAGIGGWCTTARLLLPLLPPAVQNPPAPKRPTSPVVCLSLPMPPSLVRLRLCPVGQLVLWQPVMSPITDM